LRRERLWADDPPGRNGPLSGFDAARLITGDTLYVDGGYHIVD
jgi:hypothetical protein